MFLRNDIDDVMDRTKRFFENKEGGALILVRDIKSIKPPSVISLNKWSFPEDLYRFLDANIESFTYHWSQRQNICDDMIPSISPAFGIAEHSAFVGGTVDFTDRTSWHHPVIKNWDDMDSLELREDNTWIRMVIDGLKYLKERSQGQYAIKLRGGYGPMDLANALRGNELFTDFFDYPQEVHRLLDFCVEAVNWSLSRQHEAVGQFYGGVVTGFNVWMPGFSTGHLSEDAAALCSPAIYRKFGMPYTEKMVEKYDHVFMHVHALGKHSFSDIADIGKIDVFDICDDPNCAKAIEIYRQIGDGCMSGRIVGVSLTAEDLEENLEFLKQRKTIIWYDAKNIEDAVDAVGLVRKELGV